VSQPKIEVPSRNESSKEAVFMKNIRNAKNEAL